MLKLKPFTYTAASGNLSMSQQLANNTSSSDLKSDSEVLMRVENVGKVFCRDLKQSLIYGFKDSVKDLVLASRKSSSTNDRQLRKHEFWANQGVSFELRRGECLGLIGHNGAGKTTLLKMLNGLIKPDTGRIEIRGRVGALIALGAGFNPILTGRENIYINGSVLGLSKREINEKIEEIIDFAEIREFIDSPVQTYSSGMQARLGFACASNFDADILIIDEVLAVGDFAFRQKCFRKLAKFIENGGTGILVSHALEQIMARTTRCIFLEHGKMMFDGPPREALLKYENATVAKTFAEAAENTWDAEKHNLSEIQLESNISIMRAQFEPEDSTAETVRTGDRANMNLTLKIHKNIDFVKIGLSVFSQQEVIVVQSLVEIQHLKPGVSLLQCKLAPLPLRAGSYPIQIRVHDNYNACLAVIDRKDFLLRIEKQEGWDEQSQRTSATSIIDLESIWTDPVEISKESFA
jgi:lipopolysaccharide transport system ATP-binding protein